MQPSPLLSHDEDLTSDPTSAMVVVDDTTVSAEVSRGRIYEMYGSTAASCTTKRQLSVDRHGSSLRLGGRVATAKSGGL